MQEGFMMKEMSVLFWSLDDNHLNWKDRLDVGRRLECGSIIGFQEDNQVQSKEHGAYNPFIAHVCPGSPLCADSVLGPGREQWAQIPPLRVHTGWVRGCAFRSGSTNYYLVHVEKTTQPLWTQAFLAMQLSYTDSFAVELGIEKADSAHGSCNKL